MINKVKLNLEKINESLIKVEENWKSIDDKLYAEHIGRKDTPFNSTIRENMMCGYEYLNYLLISHIEPFSNKSLSMMLELNNYVHYGNNTKLKFEYNKAVIATSEKFYSNIEVLNKWYKKHTKRKDNPLKLASEIYVGIIGHPQLFIEGNHRTGSIIASWINLYNNYPPFILTQENAIAYFKPSSEIKHFSNKSTWRGRMKLPKYRKSFRKFWEEYIDNRYILNI
jgi:hypothetical protein